ncbi:MAG: hypothetical protein BWY82_03016 [Verrucomicrobia bacterium ADurb.Bin474]|nr:MAG: hypothetical protein BWY82_03016 [Verrucomicrobia bacterium ADurb.Bin474]
MGHTGLQVRCPQIRSEGKQIGAHGKRPRDGLVLIDRIFLLRWRVDWIHIRIPFNLRHNPVLPPDPDATHAIALTATRWDPDILLNFGRFCSSHLAILSLNYMKLIFLHRMPKYP